jgi:hypothetical protein
MKSKIYCLLWSLMLIPFFVFSQKKTPSLKTNISLKMVEGLPVFTMMIIGKGPYNFVFDTGKMGEEIDISKDIENVFQFEVVDTLLIGDPTGKNSVLLPIVSIPSVSIDRLSLVNVKASVDAHLPTGVNGVVGLLFFKDFLLTLDLFHHQLILMDPEPGLRLGRNTIAYTSMMGIPVIQISIGSHNMDAQLDCGNTSASIVIPEELAKQLEFMSQVSEIGKAKTMFNEVDMKQVKIDENLHFGPYIIKQPVISFPSFGNFVNLGSNFLREFLISIDQKNQRIKMIKNGNRLETLN